MTKLDHPRFHADLGLELLRQPVRSSTPERIHSSVAGSAAPPGFARAHGAALDRGGGRLRPAGGRHLHQRRVDRQPVRRRRRARATTVERATLHRRLGAGPRLVREGGAHPLSIERGAPRAGRRSFPDASRRTGCGHRAGPRRRTHATAGLRQCWYHQYRLHRSTAGGRRPVRRARSLVPRRRRLRRIRRPVRRRPAQARRHGARRFAHLDPHKWLYAPMGIGCVLVRDRAALEAAFRSAATTSRTCPATK